MELKLNIDTSEALVRIKEVREKVQELKKEVQELNALIENKVLFDDYVAQLHTGEVILPKVKWNKYCDEIAIELGNSLIGKREDEVDEFIKRFNERLRDILDK